MSDRRMGKVFDQSDYVMDAREEAMIAARRIGRMADPERFSDALTRMPLSTAPVEYEPSYHADPHGRFPPATFDERFRGM